MWKTFAAPLTVAAAVLLASCGGGGGDPVISTGPGVEPPVIFASVISFPEGDAPDGFVPPGFNTRAEVEVLDAASGDTLTGASVSVNGVALTYSAQKQYYEGSLSVLPGATVTVIVASGGTAHTATATQFSAYPSITAPLAGATWSPSDANLVAWSGGGPAATALYALGVADAVDPAGTIVWPPGNSVEILPLTMTSYSIGAGSLTTGDRVVLVGIATAVDFTNAAPGSGFVIGGFAHVLITVATPPPAALLSIAVTPSATTLVKGRTRQLVATGSYSDGSARDLTSQVTWTSSDPTKVYLGPTGLATAVEGGTATVWATLGSIAGSSAVNVFVPNPSPAPPLSQSVTYQIDYAHSGRAAFAVPLTFPASAAWSVTLNGAASYPLIAEDKVFVTTASGGTPYGTSLYALDQQTGAIVWGPVAIPGTYYWSGHAYGHGRIFVVNFDGLLRSFDAATGQADWSVQLPGQYAFSSPPTAVNGIVYVGGAGSGGTLYAIDESNGDVLWTTPVTNGDHSSPALSDDGVFVSYPCQVYKLDPLAGTPLWHDSGGCSGGGGKTSAFAGGRLYVRDPGNDPAGMVFNATTGAQEGDFSATPIPAFSAQSGFFLDAGTLYAVDSSSNSVLWSFAGDGGLVSAPIVIDQAVIVGSSSGNVYALDAASGAELWSGSAGAGIAAPDEQNVSQPLTGFGAGEGYLVVPAGNRVTAWRLVGP